MNYLFDTSAFIAWWHEIYPKNVFPDVAEIIEYDIANGRIQASIEVKQELEVKLDDELSVWVKQQNNLFVNQQSNPQLQSRIAELSNAYPKLIKQQSRVSADPVVIARTLRRPIGRL